MTPDLDRDRVPSDRLATWTTVDELDYLDNIGTFSAHRLDRLELLRGYQKALGFRVLSERYLDFRKLERRVRELIDV